MTVTAVRKDAESCTMTLEAEFDTSPERVWQLWADPRRLERWWRTADVPGDGRCSRPAPRRPRRVPHERAGGRSARGFLGGGRGPAPAPARLPRRLRQRGRRAERRAPDDDHA